MKEYYYKIDNEKVQEGDICFYSEDSGDHKYHYADGIYEIIDVNGALTPIARVITNTNAIDFIQYDEELKNTIDIKYYCNKDSLIINDLTKIGSMPTNSDMLTKEYAMQNFAITPELLTR